MGGGNGGHLPHPWNLNKNDVICCRPAKYPNFSLAPLALAIDTLYFSLKRRKIRKNVRLRLRRAKNGQFFVRRAENLSTF